MSKNQTQNFPKPTFIFKNLFIYDSTKGYLIAEIDKQATVASWHSQFLALGNFSSPEINLISKLTNKTIFTLYHSTQITKANAVYYEVTNPIPAPRKEIDCLEQQPTSLGSRYELAKLPVDLHRTKQVSCISWLRVSSCGEFIASQRADMKNVIYIWGNTLSDSLDSPHSVIEQIEPITCASWSPKHTKLAICTGNSNIYLWTEDSVISVENPCDSKFFITALRWAPNGESLILLSKTQMMVCFV